VALAARTSIGPSTPSVNSGHNTSGSRYSASVSYAQIEEVTAQTGVQADTNTAFDDTSDWRGKPKQDQDPLRNVASNYQTSSSLFLSLVNQEQVEAERAHSVTGVKGAFQGILSKAIRAYEGTAQVISGDVQPRGTGFSMSL